MKSPIQNRARNRFLNRAGTRWGTTDQSQSQIQTVVKAVCGVWITDQIQSNGYLPSLAAPIGFGDSHE